MKYDIRGSLVAKIIAIALLITTSAGAALGTCGMILLAQGYGMTGDGDFYQDALCMIPLNDAMNLSLGNLREENYIHYYQLEYRYQGFACEIYKGDPIADNLAGVWGEITPDHVLHHTKTVEISSTDGDYYTLLGYLSKELSFGSQFWVNMKIHDVLQPFQDGSSLITLTVCLYLAALTSLIFLFCSAGHRHNESGILPNPQDLIPLDLYAAVVVIVFFCIASFALECIEGYYGFTGIYLLDLSIFAVCVLADGLLLLATLMTIATRLKLGKWWRNTICYKLLRWCRRLLKGIRRASADLLHILPLTWRTTALVGGILLAQTFLTLLMFDSYNSGFFFLVTLVVDLAIAAAAMWLSHQLRLLQDTARALAEGQPEAKADTSKMFFDCRRHGEHLNAIGAGMALAVEQKLKSERLKTELITNVSHDIKTPLTSIVNYVDLLKQEDLPETATKYVAVLDRQSHRLKKLTEDLVEASKASTGNIAVKPEPIVVNEIIHQAIGDYNEKLLAGRLDVIISTYEGSVMALADGRLLWRVLDNLLSNICKYAFPETRVYIDLEQAAGRVRLSVKNISRAPLNIRADELTERFVRGDASRHTEGSGLGLNIAQSLMELMGGTFRISTDGDLFKVELTLPAV